MTEWHRPSARYVATLLAEHIIDLCRELLRRGQRRNEMWCEAVGLTGAVVDSSMPEVKGLWSHAMEQARREAFEAAADMGGKVIEEAIATGADAFMLHPFVMVLRAKARSNE